MLAEQALVLLEEEGEGEGGWTCIGGTGGDQQCKQSRQQQRLWQ